jgi:hypothetical protein
MACLISFVEDGLVVTVWYAWGAGVGTDVCLVQQQNQRTKLQRHDQYT